MVCPGCAPTVLGRSRRGQLAPGFKVAIARKRRDAWTRVQARLRSQFGDITERDAAIFSIGVNVGYAKGYASGHYKQFQRRQAS